MTKFSSETWRPVSLIRSLLVVVLVMIFQVAFANFLDKTVTGRITNDAGQPMAGVTVSVKNGTAATATNSNGEFSLLVPDNAVLEISYVGFTTQEITVGDRTTLNVTLSRAAGQQLDEVVVIGYGTASKRDLTGSIVKVAGREVADKPNANPVASLQGKVAGLTVVNNGDPGSRPDIRIRGTVSIGQVHPLYVVDGILQDDISYINPNDIESMEVLKDPSSLAIFGVRGATGVIAITTKRARAGQTVINFNSTVGFKKLVDKIRLVNAAEFTRLFTQENTNNGVTTPDYSQLTSNTDWIDAVTRTGLFNNSNLSVSVGSAKNKFNFGVGYTLDQGIIKHQQLQKGIATISDEVTVSDHIKIGANLNVSREYNPILGQDGILDQARKVMPNVSAETKPFSVKNPYGNDTLQMNLYSGLNVALQNSGVVNPVLELENTWNKGKSTTDRYVGNVYLDITFLKKFNFRPVWYADQSNMIQRNYSPLYYAYNPMTNEPYLYNTKTSVSVSDQKWRKYQQDYILNYKNRFGSSNLTLLGGFTTYYFRYDNIFGTSSQGTAATDLPIPNDPRLWYLNNGFGYVNQGAASTSQSENATTSLLARGLYNFDNKYFINASFRNDASSRIPKKNRNQQFWSVGAAWELAREAFMADISSINSLKLKGSIGVLGNQSTYGTSGDYPAFPGLRQGLQVPFGTGIVTGALPSYKVNPDLRWETVDAKEVGVELSAFNNRFRFEANYFDKKTSDMMTYVGLASLGLLDELTNGGSLHNWGQEFSASWNQSLASGLMVNLSGNLTLLNNKVLSVASNLPGGSIIDARANNGSAEARTTPGYPIGSFFGYIVEGLYQSQKDILLSPTATSIGNYRPGDFKFKDINNDGQIDANDRTYIGNPSPKMTYGGSVNLTYKGFNLAVDMNGVYGNDIFRIWGSLESPFQRVNYAEFMTGAWTGEGTSNWVPIISQADRFNYNGSTYNIEDGSYFRIRNLTLGYTFANDFISGAKMKNLRVFASVQNLKTWKRNTGYSPEFGGSATGFGFDNAGGALPRITSFGINATF